MMKYAARVIFLIFVLYPWAQCSATSEREDTLSPTDNGFMANIEPTAVAQEARAEVNRTRLGLIYLQFREFFNTLSRAVGLTAKTTVAPAVEVEMDPALKELIKKGVKVLWTRLPYDLAEAEAEYKANGGTLTDEQLAVLYIQHFYNAVARAGEGLTTADIQESSCHNTFQKIAKPYLRFMETARLPAGHMWRQPYENYNKDEEQDKYWEKYWDL